uniref:Uncharacterized protein n=1 Tax=Anopheles farauti TaxID=69004 RepID=A0A182QCB8_9DIPT
MLLKQIQQEGAGGAQNDLVSREATATGGQCDVDQVAMAPEQLDGGHQRGAVVAPGQAIQRGKLLVENGNVYYFHVVADNATQGQSATQRVTSGRTSIIRIVVVRFDPTPVRIVLLHQVLLTDEFNLFAAPPARIASLLRTIISRRLTVSKTRRSSSSKRCQSPISVETVRGFFYTATGLSSARWLYLYREDEAAEGTVTEQKQTIAFVGTVQLPTCARVGGKLVCDQ